MTGEEARELADKVLNATAHIRLIVAPDVRDALSEHFADRFAPASPTGLYPAFLFGLPIVVDDSKPPGYYALKARYLEPLEED